MTTWYCDHGCTLYPTAYMSAPASAASLPQEGDGLASGTGAAPAAAVATMDFSTATAVAGATFAVHGAALTCVSSGAGTTQFNAGTMATLAANLAAAINAATAVPTTTTGGVAPYLKALVWASAAGAVLTVYTRIASALLNTSSNASATLACGTLGSWTAAPANASFTGGVSGPWATWMNFSVVAAAVNATISAIGTFGALVATPMGAPAGGDVVHVRTGRANADIAINGVGAATFTAQTRTIGSPTSYWEMRFDNGVVWADGLSNGVFTVNKSVTGGTGVINLNGFLHWRGLMKSGANVQAGGQVNFKINHTATDSNGYVFLISPNSNYGVKHQIIEGVEIADSGLGSWTTAVVGFGNQTLMSDPNKPIQVINCKLGVARSAASPFVSYNPIYGTHFEFIDCLHAAGGASAYTKIVHPGSTALGLISIRLVRPKFSGGGGGHHALTTWSNQCLTGIYIDDPVDMGQFQPGDSAASCCGGIAGSSSAQPTRPLDGWGHGQFLTSSRADRAFLIDTPTRLLEWRAASFPATGLSLLPNGTPFSVRFSVTHSGLAAGVVVPKSPARGIKQVVSNTLGAGTRTITEHVLIDASYGGSSYTPTDAEWWIEGTYTSATTGDVLTFTTLGTGSALAADTQAWSSLSFSPFAGASRTYSRWKFVASLPDMAANSEVSAVLMCAKQPQALNEWCFIDPQPVLT